MGGIEIREIREGGVNNGDFGTNIALLIEVSVYVFLFLGWVV